MVASTQSSASGPGRIIEHARSDFARHTPALALDRARIAAARKIARAALKAVASHPTASRADRANSVTINRRSKGRGIMGHLGSAARGPIRSAVRGMPIPRLSHLGSGGSGATESLGE